MIARLAPVARRCGRCDYGDDGGGDAAGIVELTVTQTGEQIGGGLSGSPLSLLLDAEQPNGGVSQRKLARR